MKKNRLMALLFTGAMLLSMTACGKDTDNDCSTGGYRG